MRYSFSGHETFHCRSLWLKKGIDYIQNDHSLQDDSAVVDLGVGKNMVASIKFWMRATSLLRENTVTRLGDFLFGREGEDRYCEDVATLWILHYHLVTSSIASLYGLTFIDFQREKREFDRDSLLSFVKRMCNTPEQKNVYNENTVRKDIGVLLQNYVAPTDLKQIERFSALFINLNLISCSGDDKFRFSEIPQNTIPDEIILYALFDFKRDDLSLSFDKIQMLALLFCMPVASFLERLSELAVKYSNIIDYSDNSGIRNVLFKANIDKFDFLTSYYEKL